LFEKYERQGTPLFARIAPEERLKCNAHIFVELANAEPNCVCELVGEATASVICERFVNYLNLSALSIFNLIGWRGLVFFKNLNAISHACAFGGWLHSRAFEETV
jgi:hypothetical protein